MNRNRRIALENYKKTIAEKFGIAVNDPEFDYYLERYESGDTIATGCMGMPTRERIDEA